MVNQERVLFYFMTDSKVVRNRVLWS